MSKFPQDIQIFLEPILAEGHQVWLAGSRANRTAHQNSDWDFIIIANKQLLEALSATPNPGNIDALIVTDGDSFVCPCKRPIDGATKSGSLSTWQWQITSENSASYIGSKLTDGWDCERNEIAVRILNPTLIPAIIY